MSLWKPAGSPFYHYDVQWRGERFRGSTRQTNRREAEAAERKVIEQAKQRVSKFEAAKTSLRLGDITERYWQEVGQYHKGAANTLILIDNLKEHFGGTSS
jgi:hypothetical protein